MSCVLYSDNMKRFLELFQENVKSTADCLNRLKRAIVLVADDLHIGKMNICIDAPASIYDVQGLNMDYPAYFHEDGCSEKTLRYFHEMADHGHIMIYLSPRLGYEWSKEEENTLEAFALNVFSLCANARLMDIIKKAAVTNNTTGLLNLTGLVKYANKLISQGMLRRYHGFRLNIKNFKFISQELKRETEQFLADYGRDVERFLDTDERIAHLGGDNFVGIVRDEHVEDFLKFIDEISFHTVSSTKISNISARVGLYDIQYNDTVNDLMGYLDVAINISRANGVDCIYFEQEMMQKVLHNKAISVLFSAALSSGEFHVYYQPKVNIDTKTLCGCEALVRWIQKGKVIPPMDFIPVLEEEGSICALDFYVFENVCRTIRIWIDKGLTPVNVSVNFSKLHLKNDHFAEDIFDIIDKYKVAPEYLEIELTEMSGYDNFESLSNFVEKMRKKGVRTSIDDFGTGYSSLYLLTDLEADVVKLDKSFSDKIGNEDTKTKVLLQNVVNMVQDLDYQVIAEGVETEQQADYLREIGCSTVQGFLYDKPLPEEEFEKRLVEGFSYAVS